VNDLATGVTGFASKIMTTVEESTKEFDKEQQAFIAQKAAHERDDARGLR